MTDDLNISTSSKCVKPKSGAMPIRSPLFYVGDKCKLMPQLKRLFPENIDTFFDVFCGGGSVSINISANRYIMNDIDKKIIALHRHLQQESSNIEVLIKRFHCLIRHYGLSLSELGINPEIEKLKKTYSKTYFSQYNKDAYLKLRQDYNFDQSNFDLLYLLLVYGFNHMIRFNSQGKFNLPVGNVDWNRNVTNSLRGYASWSKSNNVIMTAGLDFEDFVESQDFCSSDFLYFDPPYLIAGSDYNKHWGEKEDLRLYKLLDKLTDKGVKWGMSNMIFHKGRKNEILLNWAGNYYEYAIESNYISRFDNSIKSDSKEIYVTNCSAI